MGGGYPAQVKLFAFDSPPRIGFSLSGEEPWEVIDRLNEVMSLQSKSHISTELMMIGGWPENEQLYERMFDLFQGSHGARDSMPSNEENCFFTLLTPRQVRLVLADIVLALGPLGRDDGSNATAVLEIVAMLSDAAMNHEFVACTFCNPP